MTIYILVVGIMNSGFINSTLNIGVEPFKTTEGCLIAIPKVRKQFGDGVKYIQCEKRELN